MTLQIVNYPETASFWEPTRIIFLAGGISNCADWQSELMYELSFVVPSAKRIVVINPRRKDYKDTPEEATKQIEWEHRGLKDANVVSFWFCKETLCPITLFELGKCFGRGQKVILGSDPDYKRLLDVQVQGRLEGYKDPIIHNLKDLAQKINESV